MSSLYTLPRPVRPLEDETLASLVTRNASTYGFDNPLLVLHRLDLRTVKLPTLMNTRPDARLALLLDVDLPTLGRMSSWNETVGMANVGGREIRRAFIHEGVRRSCPACLVESLHHRAVWDVVAIGHCSRHGGALTATCPGCGKPPRWYGFQLDRCGNDDCSFDLRTAPWTEVDRMPDHVRGLRQLYDAGPEATLTGLGLQFGRAVEVTYVLGSYIRDAEGLDRADHLLRHNPGYAADVMEAGWQTLVDWPDGFDRMLDTLRGGAEDRAKSEIRARRYGLRREFGSFVRWFSGKADEPWTAVLRQAFADYLARHPDLSATARGLRRYGSPAMLRSQHMTLHDAAAFLDVSNETMAELADRDELYVVRRSGAGTPCLLRADLVQALRNRKQATLTREEAAEILGVGQTALRRMMETGLLGTVAERERVTHFRLLRRAEVEAVVEKARQTLEVCPPRGKLIPLLFSMGGRRDMLDVLRAVLDGRVRARAVRLGQPGLRGLLFDSREIKDVVSPQQETLTLIAASERLDIDIESVRVWAKEGFLATVTSSSPFERGRRVREGGISAFKAAFMTSGELGQTASTSGRWAAERMAFLGYPGLCASSVTKLYRRSDITPEVVACLRTKTANGRAASAAAAVQAVERIGQDVAARLGLDLRKSRNGFSDVAGRTHVQVVVGRRQTTCSKYFFRFNPAMRARLAAAEEGWLVLALPGFDTYLLVPWSVAQSRMGAEVGHRQHVRVAVDGCGRVLDGELALYQRWFLEETIPDACAN